MYRLALMTTFSSEALQCYEMSIGTVPATGNSPPLVTDQVKAYDLRLVHARLKETDRQIDTVLGMYQISYFSGNGPDSNQIYRK